MDHSLYNQSLHNSTNSSNEDYETYHSQYLEQLNLITRIFLELYTILSLICIAANILIIFVTMKYRRIRHEKTNLIVANWAVLNTFFMLSQPISVRITMYWIRAWGSTTFCILEQAEYTALFGCVLFIMLLFIYWFLKLYYPRKYAKLTNYNKFVLGSVYIFCLFTLGLHVQTCFDKRYYILVMALSLLLTYTIFILFMIIMNIVHLIKKRKISDTRHVSNIPLILSNTFFLSIFPFLIILIVQVLTRIEPINAFILTTIALIMAVMNPIYFFIVLYKRDKDYKSFFGYVLRCRCNKYGNDEMEEDPVVFNGEVHIHHER